MATTFPTSLQDLDATRGAASDPLSAPNHVTHHTTEDDTIEALQAKVGIDSSAVTTSHDYKLSSVTGTAKAVVDTRTITTTAPVTIDGGASANLTANRTIAVSAASVSASGVIEVATSAETDTGTDAARAISPDGFAGSNYGTRVIGIQVVASAASTTTGDGQAFVRIPVVMNGWNLVGVAAHVYTAGTTNTTDIQIRRTRSGSSVDMLSTKITIDSTEVDSSTAATAAVINASNDDVNTGDKISVDVDAVHTTPAQGLFVELRFQLP